MTVDTTPPSPPHGAKRTTKIRRFVKRVASFASIRSNSRDAKGTLDSRAHVAEPVPEHPSPYFHHRHSSSPEAAHDDAAGKEPPAPPSPLQAPTEIPRSPQNMLLSPRREDDTNSLHSGYLSDSQESSFSGLSALPSDYNRSAATSPEQVRMTLRDTSTSLDHRLSLHASPVSDTVARVDTRNAPAVEPIAALDAPRIAVFSDAGVVQEAAHSTSIDADRTPMAEPPLNSLMLDVTPPAEEKRSGVLEEIPALGTLTQLDSEFGAITSATILCPAEDELEISQGEHIAISSNAANGIAVTQTSETGSQTPDLPLPLEPTLPAIPEASSGADPDYLDLDLPAEADVYIAGQPDLVSDAVALITEIPTAEEAFTESLILALPLDAPPAAHSKGASSRHEVAVEIRNVVLTPSVAERASPLDEVVTETPVAQDTCRHVDDLPVIEPFPPPFLDDLVRQELTSSNTSVFAMPVGEAPAENDDLAVEDAAVRPDVESSTLAPAEAEAVKTFTPPVHPPSVSRSEGPEPVESPAERLLELPSVVVNARVYPVVEIYPSVRSETETTAQFDTPVLPSQTAAANATPASLAIQRPVIEALPPAEIDELIRAELPSSSASSIFNDVAPAPTEQTDTEPESALERPVIEPCPPPEIDALIAAEMPSTPLSLASSGVSMPSEDSDARPLVESDAASDADTAEKADCTIAVEDDAVAPVHDEVGSEDASALASFVPAGLEVDQAQDGPVNVVEESVSPLAAASAALIPQITLQNESCEDPALLASGSEAETAAFALTDHVEERPVMGRFPTEDDELAIAAIADSLPPLDDSEDCVIEFALSSAGPESDAPRVESESDSEEFTPLSDEAPSDASITGPETQESSGELDTSTTAVSAIEAAETSPTHPLDILVSPPDDIVPSLPHLSVDRDLPELVHSLPTSSNSSEYGDELEDPPYPSSLAVPVPLAHGTKHLPLASRTVHLSLCYSLTWWLSKHPMF